VATYLTKSINKPLGGSFARRYVPLVQVSFHTETTLYQVRGIPESMRTDADPTNQLISVTTTKSLSSPAGTFTIVLAGDGWFMPDGLPKLKPNDLAVIYMGYKPFGKSVLWVDGTLHTSDEDLSTVMVGLIDTVTRTRSGGGNGVQPQVTTTITGRDFGKLLIKSMLKFYPELNWDTTKEQHFFLTQVGWVTLLQAFTGADAIMGSPARILDTIMRSILKKLVGVQWKVYDDNTYGSSGGPKTAELGNLLRYRFAKTDFSIPFYMTAQQYEGSVWNLMERVNLKPFTELFVDTRDRWEVDWGNGHDRQLVTEVCEESSDEAKGQLSDEKGKWAYPATMFGKKDGAQAVVTFRNTPFTKGLWDKLRKHEVDEVDIITETLSYSDNENYNVFWAGTTLTPFASTFDLKRVNPPMINEENIKRYGLGALEVQIEGLQLRKENEAMQTIELTAMSKSQNQKLKDWFEHNNEYLSGTLEMRGKGDLKIGQKLIHRALNLEFYVEGVTQSFQIFGEWHTVAQVTRGRVVT